MKRTVPALLAAVCLGGSLLLAPAATAAPDPSTRTPGTPVSTVPQFDQSANGGTNPQVGSVPRTRSLGTPDAGVVPVVGKVSAKADDGAYVRYETKVSSRVVDLMVTSPGLGGTSPVRLYLPSGFSSSSGRTWPTLYLLGGASDKADYQSWSVYTDLLDYASSKGAIIAMPSVGKTGLGTNWRNGGQGASGGYQWSTYLGQELPQLLERGYAASTSRRAVAGISTGGFTATTLASEFPGRYGALATFSGLSSLQSSTPLVQSLLVREGFSTDKPFGSPFGSSSGWSAADPSQRPERLQGLPIFVSSGNGRLGPLDPPDPFGFFKIDALESATLVNGVTFSGQLRRAGVSATTDFYGDGTHSWPYWSRELKKAWPQLAQGLGL